MRLARLRAGLTQEALAKLVGMKQPSLAYLENPTKPAAGSEYTVKLARVLGVSVDWLDDEVGEMIPTVYSTTDPTLVEILKVLEPRGKYAKMAAHRAVVRTVEEDDNAAKASEQPDDVQTHRPQDRRKGLHFYGGYDRRGAENKNGNKK